MPARREAEEVEARLYAKEIWAHDDYATGFWRSYNLEIAERWSWTALRRVKARAWQIVEGPK